MTSFVRKIGGLLFSPPRGVGHGLEVMFKYPRRIEGARHIHCGDRVIVGEHSWIAAFDHFRDQRFHPRIQIGSDVNIGRYCCITAIDRIVVGDNCLFSEHVYISDHGHGHLPNGGLLKHQALHSKGPVHIGSGVFLGYRSVVLPGVTLGDHCVVGANAVVTRSHPAGSMLVGSPARSIKRYDADTGSWVPVG